MLRIFIATMSVADDAIDAIHELRRDAAGVTAIEYGLIAGAIAVAIIATVITLGGDIKNLFAATGSAISSTTGSSL